MSVHLKFFASAVDRMLAILHASKARRLARRVAALEAAIQEASRYAYRDGCTTLVQASSFDALLSTIGLPRVEGREVGSDR